MADNLGSNALSLDAAGIGADPYSGIPNRTNTTVTGTGTNLSYQPGVTYYNNDPFRGTPLDKIGVPLDPLGLFDVPQINLDISQMSPEYLAQVVANQARANAYASAGLEQELTPEVVAARKEAMQQLLADIQAGGTLGSDIETALQKALGTNQDIAMPELQQSALLQAARDKALADLGLEGELPQDVRNLVARTAAQKASGGGYLGSQIGRDIGARDLGLTSLDLYNQRLNTASQLGAGEEATNLAQQGLAANIALQNRAFQQQNLLNVTNQLQNLRQQEFANRFGTAQFTQGIEQPVAGLDAGDLASYLIAQENQRNELVNQANIAQGNINQQAKQGQNDLIGGVFKGLMGAFCWVARETYGEDDGRWLLFRVWLLSSAPEWFFNLYANHGERFAGWLRMHSWLKRQIRWWMNARVKHMINIARI